MQHAEALQPLAGVVHAVRFESVERGVEEGAVVVGLGALQRSEEEPRPLARHEVAADGFAPAVARGRHVEEVVLDLEGAAEGVPGVAQPLAVGGRGAADEGAEVEGEFEEGAGLAVDHAEVGLWRHVAAALEGEVERLPLAELGDGRVVGAEGVAELLRLRLPQEVCPRGKTAGRPRGSPSARPTSGGPSGARAASAPRP